MAIVLYEGIMCCIFVDYDGGRNSCMLACSKSGWMVGVLEEGEEVEACGYHGWDR